MSMNETVPSKDRRAKPMISLRPSDLVNKPRFDLIEAYKDGQSEQVQAERRSYEVPRSGRFNDGIPVRRATLAKPGLVEEVPDTEAPNAD